MGINNYIEFGGVKSSDYGIYVSGEGTFNAPERDVELIEIPGRNGDFSLDKGRFKNITVTYPVYNFESNLDDFRTKLSDFRNALKSKIGYQRLEDTFHPTEYRMATFVDAFDVKPVMYNTASAIELTFNCKPQRFLKSGEEPQTIGEWGETQTVSGSIATFDAEFNTGIKSLVVDIEPVQSGTGDPSPTNIRPISGWDSVKVNHSGKNFADISFRNQVPSTANGQMTSAVSGWSTNFIKVDSNKDYVATLDRGIDRYILFYDENKNYLGYSQGFSYTGYLLSAFAHWEETKYVKLRVDGTAATKFELQLELGSTATEYEPYQGSTITKSLGQTVYGGVLDVVSGKLVIDRAFKQVAPTDTMRMVGDICQINYDPPSDNAWQNLICSHFPTKSIWSGTTNEGIGCWSGQFYFRWLAIGTTIEAWRQFFTDNNVQFTYTLATPIEVNLTPTEINTLLGQNNIWADSGEVSVEIGEDPNILVNPTPFESQPLLEFAGLGDININDDVITVHDSAMGKVLLANKTARGDNPDIQTESRFNSGNYSLLENGDLIRVEDGSTMYAIMSPPQASVLFDSFSASVTGGTIGATVIVTDESTGTYNVVLEPFNYTKGTFLVHTVEVSVSFSITINGAVTSWDGVITYRYEYDPSFIPRVYYGLSTSPDLPSGFNNAMTRQSYLATIYGYSTRTGGGVQYIDLGIGEAYIMTDGVPVSINNIVSIPARLPELKSGDNHITHDDTITSLKITPRWWKI